MVKKYLFICRHNFTRSRFSAEFFRGYLKGKGIKGKVYSAGTGFSSKFIGKRVSEKLLKKVDWVFVMEDYMKDYIVKHFDFPKERIVVFGIPDDYGFWKKKKLPELDKLFEKFKWDKYL